MQEHFNSGPADLQHYPTPQWLADKAFALFDEPNVDRLLDACAGAGALADAWLRGRQGQHYAHIRRDAPVDAIEIDARHHPALRGKGYNVVGLDFLAFEGGAIYSHVIMNPPFANGARHVLKAWDMLWSGEIVAIINAQTLRNPGTIERRRLAALVEEHGSVEFIADAFKGADVERPADVEIALVHLVKPAQCADDWIGPLIESLQADDRDQAQAGAPGMDLPRDLALPRSFVENQCIAFRQAVKAMREAVRAQAVAAHFAQRIGKTMVEQGREATAPEISLSDTESVRTALRKRYLELKDRAWTSVLRSTDALQRLSSKVARQAESQFEQIKTLDFCEANVYGFLLGLVQSQPEMQLEMCEDVFDKIVRYHTDNGVFYRGWKSNDRHRTAGMRIKSTRFIIPGHSANSWSRSLSWDSERFLADFDKVFAMLDGKAEPQLGLVQAFRSSFDDLKRGKRIQTSYFDVRYYPGIGTIHFFPRSKELMDRLNRVVGQRRAWLPPETEQGCDALWQAYERAEKLDTEVRAAIDEARRARAGGTRFMSSWDDPCRNAWSGDEEQRAKAQRVVLEGIDKVLAHHKLLAAIEAEEARKELARNGAAPVALLAD